MKKEFEVISQIIQNNKRVLDIGCGDGTLMEYLKVNQQNDVRGLEPEKNLVQKCISKGLPVIEGDAEKELVQFPKKSFDYVVLSQTLQAFFKPEEASPKGVWGFNSSITSKPSNFSKPEPPIIAHIF